MAAKTSEESTSTNRLFDLIIQHQSTNNSSCSSCKNQTCGDSPPCHREKSLTTDNETH